MLPRVTVHSAFLWNSAFSPRRATHLLCLNADFRRCVGKAYLAPWGAPNFNVLILLALRLALRLIIDVSRIRETIRQNIATVL